MRESRCDLTPEELVGLLTPVVKEYFQNGDIAEVFLSPSALSLKKKKRKKKKKKPEF